MRKFLIIAILSVLTTNTVLAQSQFGSTLTRIEKSIFGIEYESQSDEQRLKRIEEAVYGSVSTNATNQRVEKLSKDINADILGQEIKPKKDTFMEDEEKYSEPIPKADSNVNYPIINQLEQKVFKKEFRTNEVNERLSNLEQNTFKKTFNDDLNKRVERLKSVIIPEYNNALAQNDEDEDSQTNLMDDLLSRYSPKQNNFEAPQYNNQQDYNSQNSVTDDYQAQADVTIPLGALEKSILKKSYPNDTVPNRLTRLELKMFSSPFFDDDEQSRVERISSAYQAKKSSSKYDSNKFSQHMSTAMQIGALILMVVAAIL